MTIPHIHPTRDQFEALSANVPADTPVLMFNLLRFNSHAAYPPEMDAAPCSGREAYARYTRSVLPRIEAVGASVVASGTAAATLIGPAEEDWDSIFVVAYPNLEAFLSMIQDPGYAAIVGHRTAALADSRLYAVCPGQLV